MTYFEIIGEITKVKTIAIGRKIRDLRHLVRRYGEGRWQKLKGVARGRIHGRIQLAEVHWYETQGVGKRRLKIKRFLD